MYVLCCVALNTTTVEWGIWESQKGLRHWISNFVPILLTTVIQHFIWAKIFIYYHFPHIWSGYTLQFFSDFFKQYWRFLKICHKWNQLYKLQSSPQFDLFFQIHSFEPILHPWTKAGDLKHVGWSTRFQQNAPDLSGEALYMKVTPGPIPDASRLEHLKHTLKRFSSGQLVQK
jgi:hypothetical protein